MEEKNTNLGNFTNEEKEKQVVENNVLDNNLLDNNEQLENVENVIVDKNIQKNNFSETKIEATLSEYTEISHSFYAGFWVRFLAYTIDVIIIIFIGRLFNTLTLGKLELEIGFLNSILSYVICYYSYFFLMTYFFSQTLGKMIFAIRVERNEGGKASLVDILYREVVGRFLSDVLKFLPYLVVAFTPKKKGLHDYISDTVVVKEDFINLRQKLNNKIKSK